MAGKAARGATMTLVVLAALAGSAAVFWNMFGAGTYGETCSFSLGCRSFYCLKHQQMGEAQMSSGGHCTKECSDDNECGEGAVCVTLSDASRDDLPPLGKPDKACMVVRAPPK